MQDRIRAIDALLANSGGNPAALLRIAQLLQQAGEKARAMEIAETLLDPGSGAGAATAERARALLSGSVPDWHFAIVRDAARNSAYDDALRRAIRPGMRVLEIGAGTGILAMMAARAGAAAVYSCEVNPVIAERARRIVADNGYADRVHILARHSTELDAQADLGGRADLLVSEIVSTDVIAQGVLAAHAHAVAHLLVPGAPVIPGHGVARVALAEWPGAARMRMGTVAGFDLGRFDSLAPRVWEISPSDPALVVRSEAADLFDFDLGAGSDCAPAERRVELRAHGGRVDGIIQWLALRMDGSGRYEAGPGAPRSSAWMIRFMPFDVPFDAEPGRRFCIGGAHDRGSVTIWPD